MKKFSIHFLFMIASIFALYILASKLWPFMFKGADYLNWNYKYSLPLKSLNKKILIYGDSSTLAGIVPLKISSDSINMAVSGGVPFDAFTHINRLLRKGIIPKKVVINYSLSNYFHDDGFLSQNINFNFYTLKELNEALIWQKNNSFYFHPEKDFQRLMPSPLSKKFFANNGNNFRYYLSLLEVLMTKLNLSLIDLSRIQSFISLKDYTSLKELEDTNEYLNSTQGHLTFPKRKFSTLRYPTFLYQKEVFPIHPFNNYYLEKLLKTLSRNSIDTVLDFAPMPEMYYKKLSPEFLKGFSKFFKDLQKKYSFHADLILQVYPDTFYTDQVHLDKRGAMKYTHYLKRTYFQD